MMDLFEKILIRIMLDLKGFFEFVFFAVVCVAMMVACCIPLLAVAYFINLIIN